ncbi:hypothetical protein Droror1_Dr00014440 [Drosera rotundifolia]
MAPDHYKILGVSPTATKDQIKEAFRRLALEFHPDRHSRSSKSALEDATIKFKQVSEAYEVLSDDRKRAAYNISRRSGSGIYGGDRRGSNAGSYYYRRGSYGGGGAGAGAGAGEGLGWAMRFEVLVRFLTTRAFLLNVAFAGVLLGGSMMIDASRERLWKVNNSGKSFEEAMESLEKNKARKDKN